MSEEGNQVHATGVATRGAFLGGKTAVGKLVEKAMSRAAVEARKEGLDDDAIRDHMLAARKRVIVTDRIQQLSRLLDGISGQLSLARSAVDGLDLGLDDLTISTEEIAEAARLATSAVQAIQRGRQEASTIRQEVESDENLKELLPMLEHICDLHEWIAVA